MLVGRWVGVRGVRLEGGGGWGLEGVSPWLVGGSRAVLKVGRDKIKRVKIAVLSGVFLMVLDEVVSLY